MVEETPIILDIGSYSIKAGTAEDEEPQCNLRTVIGETSDETKYYGENVFNNISSMTNITYPIQKGLVDDYDDIEGILKFVIEDSMSADASLQPIIMTEGVLYPNMMKQQYAELLFEKFETPGLYYELVGNCALLPIDLDSGLIVDIGHSSVQISPFYEGMYLFNAADKQGFGGEDCSKHLAKIMAGLGVNLDIVKDCELLHSIKEKCSIAKCSSEDSNKVEYTLPDGKVIELNGNEIIEPLLIPMSIDKTNEMKGISQMIVDCVMKCPMDCRSLLFEQIHIVGGGAMIPKIDTRIKEEVTKILTAHNNVAEVNVNVYENSDTMAWYGAACTGSLSSVVERYCTKDQYDENGAFFVSQMFSREG
ncbi:actin [Entamoeba marina]